MMQRLNYRRLLHTWMGYYRLSPIVARRILKSIRARQEIINKGERKKWKSNGKL